MNPQRISSRSLARWTACLALAFAACSSQPSTTSSEATSEDVVSGGSDAIATKDSIGPADASTPTQSGFTVESVNPPEGKAGGGEWAVINGHGFAEGVHVVFGNAPMDPAGIFVIDDTQIQLTTPPHETGLVDITVSLPGDAPKTATLHKGFLYYNDVIVTKVDPPQGPTAGGTAISIHGSGFTGDCQVLVGGKQALNVQLVSDDTVTAITPPGTFGSVPVHVINARGTGLLKKGFFYTAAPTVTSVAPASGPTAGG